MPARNLKDPRRSQTVAPVEESRHERKWWHGWPMTVVLLLGASGVVYILIMLWYASK